MGRRASYRVMTENRIAVAKASVFYHIYPLGLCAAPERNDFTSPPQPRIDSLRGWRPCRSRSLDCDAPGLPDGPLVDLLEPDRSFIASHGKIRVEKVPARWARILSVTSRPSVIPCDHISGEHL
jgi:hypothetical protein